MTDDNLDAQLDALALRIEREIRRNEMALASVAGYCSTTPVARRIERWMGIR